jgi:hypothetical protein
MGIKKGEEGQTKGQCNIFSKITEEKFPNLEKEMPIHLQAASRTSSRLDKNITSPKHIIITISTKN